jgi:hypothetical protein
LPHERGISDVASLRLSLRIQTFGLARRGYLRHLRFALFGRHTVPALSRAFSRNRVFPQAVSEPRCAFRRASPALLTVRFHVNPMSQPSCYRPDMMVSSAAKSGCRPMRKQSSERSCSPRHHISRLFRARSSSNSCTAAGSPYCFLMTAATARDEDTRDVDAGGAQRKSGPLR